MQNNGILMQSSQRVSFLLAISSVKTITDMHSHVGYHNKHWRRAF